MTRSGLCESVEAERRPVGGEVLRANIVLKTFASSNSASLASELAHSKGENEGPLPELLGSTMVGEPCGPPTPSVGCLVPAAAQRASNPKTSSPSSHPLCAGAGGVVQREPPPPPVGTGVGGVFPSEKNGD